MDWQPIETAPKDGTHVLVYYDDDAAPYWNSDGSVSDYAQESAVFGKMTDKGMTIAAWLDDGEGPPAWSHICEVSCVCVQMVWPTHWMPLPAPPQEGQP